jgi:photoactive yellow protein
MKEGFHVEQVIGRLENIGEAELEELPIGMIQLDRDGKVLRYNRTEGELARRKPAEQIGKSFFDEVAPCTKVKEFHGRFQAGVAKKSLNETFAFPFKFSWGRTDVVITLFYSAGTDTVWVLVSRKKEKL